MGHTNLLLQKTSCRMNKEEGLLLHLMLHYLLGKDKQRTINADYKIDWHDVYGLAVRQGVSAILLEAISKLPYDDRPPKSLLFQWIGQTTMMERMLLDDKARETMKNNARQMIGSRFERNFVQSCQIEFYKEIM